MSQAGSPCLCHRQCDYPDRRGRRPCDIGQLARVAWCPPNRGRGDPLQVALRLVLQQYAPPTEIDARLSDSAFGGAAIRLAFPTIVTPYGIATVIIILSVSPNTFYVVGVGAVLIRVMILNLLAMLYARKILELVGMMPLQIISAVLSVLQVALGVQMILGGLRMIGLLE